MSDIALNVRDLSYSLNGRQLLNRINVSFAAGQLHVLLGPNGAGKSTLLKQVMSDSHPSGQVDFWATPKAGWHGEHFAKQVAFLPQSSGLTFAFTVKEVVQMGRRRYKRVRRKLPRWPMNSYGSGISPTLPTGHTLFCQAVKNSESIWRALLCSWSKPIQRGPSCYSMSLHRRSILLISITRYNAVGRLPIKG
nr:ATP-binding cassette domain-containing protein [Salinivibrio costicola]